MRHRLGKAETTQVLMRWPSLGWIPTEADKVQRFEALGIDRAVLPYRAYGEGKKAQKRFLRSSFLWPWTRRRQPLPTSIRG